MEKFPLSVSASRWVGARGVTPPFEFAGAGGGAGGGGGGGGGTGLAMLATPPMFGSPTMALPMPQLRLEASVGDIPFTDTDVVYPFPQQQQQQHQQQQQKQQHAPPQLNEFAQLNNNNHGAEDFLSPMPFMTNNFNNHTNYNYDNNNNDNNNNTDVRVTDTVAVAVAAADAAAGATGLITGRKRRSGDTSVHTATSTSSSSSSSSRSSLSSSVAAAAAAAAAAGDCGEAPIAPAQAGPSRKKVRLDGAAATGGVSLHPPPPPPAAAAAAAPPPPAPAPAPAPVRLQQQHQQHRQQHRQPAASQSSSETQGFALAVTRQPDFQTCVSKQQLCPPYQVELRSCGGGEAPAPAAEDGVWFLVEMFFADMHPIPNVLNREGSLPAGHAVVRADDDGDRPGAAVAATFAKLRFHASYRGKHIYVTFAAYRMTGEPAVEDGGVFPDTALTARGVLLARSAPVPLVVVSSSNHLRDEVAKQVWKRLGNGAAAAKAGQSVSAAALRAGLAGFFGAHFGAPLSSADLDTLLPPAAPTTTATATTTGMISFELFKREIWVAAFDAYKILKKQQTSRVLYSLGFLPFGSFESSAALLRALGQKGGRGAVRPGDCVLHLFAAKRCGAVGLTWVTDVDPASGAVRGVGTARLEPSYLARHDIMQCVMDRPFVVRVANATASPGDIFPKADLCGMTHFDYTPVVDDDEGCLVIA